MTGIAHQANYGDETNEMPRFLSHGETDSSRPRPPPLPRARWPVRVRRLATLAAAFVIVVPAAVALVADGGGRPSLPPQAEAGAGARDQVSEALRIVDALEARLGYARHLPVYQDAAAAGPSGASGGHSRPEASPPETPAFAAADTVALLILRNLPDSVTFSAGSPVGKGAWAMPAGDPNQLVMTLGEGFDTPVTTDVEMISQAGLTIGSLRLTLRKDGAADVAAKATAAPNPDVTGSIGESDDGEDKPVKRTRHARVRHHDTTAHAEPELPRKRRVKRVATSAKVKVPEAAEDTDSAEVVALPENAGPKPGLISKLFGWLKPGTNKSAEDDTSGSKAAMFPQ